MALQKLLRLLKGKAQNLVVADTGQIPGDLQVDQVVKGPDDGTGVVVGHSPVGAATGSTLQILSLTTALRNNLTPATGMVIYNTTTGTAQVYNGTVWRDLAPTVLNSQTSLVAFGAGTDLHTYAMPANTLANDNDAIEVIAFITVTVSPITWNLVLGGSTLVTFVLLGDTFMTARIVRTGAATQISYSYTSTNGGFSNGTNKTTTAESFAGALTLKSTGTAGAGAGSESLFRVTKFPAP